MDSSYSLDELKSRLKMSEIEVKITTTANNGSNNLKKSRKNKTPVFKRRPSSGEENTGAMSPKSNDPRGKKKYFFKFFNGLSEQIQFPTTIVEKTAVILI